MDKGVGTVILDTEAYYDKLDVIIRDVTRFEKIEYNINASNPQECYKAPWIIKEQRVQRYCRQYIKPVVDDKTYWRIYPQGSQPGKLYGMAKNHKKNCPLRPVLSAINTPEYYLAKWFEKQLKPFLTDQYSVASSAVFVEELQHTKPTSSDICVSFDICSLYTNVPLLEVIEDITTTVFSKSKTSKIFDDNPKVTPTIFRNMLRLCSESVFLYKDAVYKQCDGVAMGSPLAPLLANWFVVRMENKILNNPKHLPYKPKMYRRYVDDIFAVFKSPKERDQFFETINAAHPNLRFTMEVSSSALPFLDVSVVIKNDAYDIKVYRKPTNTGVLMHYESTAPLRWKKALVRCLLRRAMTLSSNYDNFISETQNIKSNFLNNGYPAKFVETELTNFVSEFDIKKNNFTKTQPEKEKKSDTELTKAYLCVPFVGRPSTKIQTRIRRELLHHQVKAMSAFKTQKVGSYFSLKPTSPFLFQSNVVYKFTCHRDGGPTYIGETRRQLFQRVTDHRGKDKKSAVFDHLYNCLECQSVSIISNQFEILKKCDARNLLTFEALLIEKNRPALNIQLGPTKGRMVSLALYN